MSTRPFSEPGDGVIYDRFADDALYSIHITDPNTGAELIRYDFTFTRVNPLTAPGLKNPNTILAYGLGTAAGAINTIGDARQNFTQTYTLVRTVSGTPTTLGTSLPTPPPNVGLRTTPLYNDANGVALEGVGTTFTDLDDYTENAVVTVPNGGVGEGAFAGPREDGFYADTPGIFDFIDSRILGSDGNGVDGFKGFNILSFGLQIPLTSLPATSITGNRLALPDGPGVGVYASVSRRRITSRSATGDVSSGPWVQVNRMGNPLFNEVFVALADKDRYNRTSPTIDATDFANYAVNPELAFLINTIYGTNLVGTGRNDLRGVFIPDVLRVRTNTGPTVFSGQAGFNRLSVFGADLFPSTSIPRGWPNGRRFGDDVIDIALSALALGSSLPSLGDNVNANDKIFNQVFPYAGTPHAGPRNSKDSGPPLP